MDWVKVMNDDINQDDPNDPNSTWPWEFFFGTHCGSVGVYTSKYGDTYAGERKGDVAHGYGVLTREADSFDMMIVSGQFADGELHSHGEEHRIYAVYYHLYERGDYVHHAGVHVPRDVGYELYELNPNPEEHRARVEADGDCSYENQPCGADHADFVALKAAAQQAAVRMPLPASNASPHRRPKPDARAIRFSRALGFGAWPRPAALGVRCKCARVYG
jgi:hypothetical protein